MRSSWNTSSDTNARPRAKPTAGLLRFARATQGYEVTAKIGAAQYDADTILAGVEFVDRLVNDFAASSVLPRQCSLSAIFCAHTAASVESPAARQGA